jgi:hypothetical protein
LGMLHVAACPYCMSVLHVSGCISMLLIHHSLHLACSFWCQCCMFKLHVHGSMLHVHAACTVHAAFPRCMFTLFVHAACLCCMSKLYIHTASSCCNIKTNIK